MDDRKRADMAVTRPHVHRGCKGSFYRRAHRRKARKLLRAWTQQQILDERDL